MLKINKIRYRTSGKYFNTFNVYTSFLEYVVKRPINERLLTSMDKIMNCKTEEELISLGAESAPKGGKVSLDEFLSSRGIN